MKRNRHLLTLLLGVVLALGAAVTLSSCESDNYWYDDGGFYDNRLNGYWELVEYNGRGVYGPDVNYLYFGGNGRGYYYYWDGGRRYLEDMYYESQQAYTGPSDYQLNLQYGNGRPTTVNYWFEGSRNVLCMQWLTGYNQVETYVYERVYRAPW